MVWALFLGIVVAGASFTIASRFQVYADIAGAVLERDSSLKLLPLLCSVWLSPGGCSLETDSVPPPRVDVNRVNSWADLDGPDGLPDGDLDEAFERIVVAVSRGSLTIRSGEGAAQPALTCLNEGVFRQPQSDLIVLEFTAGARTRIEGRSLTVRVVAPVALRNLRSSLIPR
jgi:hypothetical protein